jgi:hypothetical protein
MVTNVLSVTPRVGGIITESGLPDVLFITIEPEVYFLQRVATLFEGVSPEEHPQQASVASLEE